MKGYELMRNRSNFAIKKLGLKPHEFPVFFENRGFTPVGSKNPKTDYQTQQGQELTHNLFLTRRVRGENLPDQFGLVTDPKNLEFLRRELYIPQEATVVPVEIRETADGNLSISHRKGRRLERFTILLKKPEPLPRGSVLTRKTHGREPLDGLRS